MARPAATLLAEAQARHQAGRLPEAARLYDQVLAARPEDPTTLALLGALRLQQGDAKAAARLLHRAAERRPADPTPRYNLGIALIRLGRHAEAATLLAGVTAQHPGHADAWKSLGDARKALHDLAGAAAAWRQALAIRPDLPGALLNLGALLTSRADGPGGEDCARRLLALRPQDPAAWNNLGLALLHQERRDEAEQAFRQALALDPDYDRAAENLGDLLMLRRCVAEAEAAYAQAVVIRESAGRAASADALAGLLHSRAMLCRWDALPAVLARLARRLDEGPIPFPLLAHGLPPAQIRRAAIAHARQIAASTTPLPPRPVSRAGRIRLGYVSPDFKEHPVGHLAVEVLTAHDRDAFAVHAYALNATDGGPTRARLAAGIETFREVHDLDDDRLAARIAEDGIDILIDLAGWTTGERQSALARRPAPVAATWLGYPGTTGAPWLDYAIVDPVVAPPGAEAEFTESLIRLPHCYLPHDSGRPRPEPPSRAACGLPEDAVVLACFAQAWKIGRPVFEAWLRILHAVPGTVLWLRAASRDVTEALHAAASRAGIARERILFASSLPSAAEHLARLGQADLVLDTWPYGGHAGAIEALWAGVPLIALAAPGFAGRVSTSALHAAGLGTLATGRVEEFVAMATHLAQDRAARIALRQQVERCRTAPLFDTPRFVRALEAACRAMHARAAAGLPPAAMAVEA